MAENIIAVRLQHKVLNCSDEEQLQFFKNVINNKRKLKIYEEELENMGASL